MVWHTAFGQLSQKIGGYFPMAAYPLHPVFENSFDLADFTAYDNGMNFFIFGGEDDPIFPPGDDVFEIYNVLNSLGLYYNQVVKYWVSAPGVGHDMDARFFDVMMQFVNEGSFSIIEDFVVADSKDDEDKDDDRSDS